MGSRMMARVEGRSVDALFLGGRGLLVFGRMGGGRGGGE